MFVTRLLESKEAESYALMIIYLPSGFQARVVSAPPVLKINYERTPPGFVSIFRNNTRALHYLPSGNYECFIPSSNSVRTWYLILVQYK